jgi:mRNA interferase RelE/StbE
MIHPLCVGYEIVLTDDAKKDLHRLERQAVTRILKKIRQLNSNNIDNLNIKKLKSKISLYRLKVGDYRVVYSIYHEVIIVNVVAVGHRKDIYDSLSRRLSM